MTSQSIKMMGYLCTFVYFFKVALIHVDVQLNLVILYQGWFIRKFCLLFSIFNFFPVTNKEGFGSGGKINPGSLRLTLVLFPARRQREDGGLMRHRGQAQSKQRSRNSKMWTPLGRAPAKILGNTQRIQSG